MATNEGAMNGRTPNSTRRTSGRTIRSSVAGRVTTIGGFGVALVLIGGCSLTASTSSTKPTLSPVTVNRANATVFPTISFSPTTSTTLAAAAAPPVVDASGNTIDPSGYTVKANDTLSGIARNLGVPYGDLLLANPDIDPTKFLIVGAKLTVPPPSAGAGQTPTQTTVAGANSATTATTANQNGVQASGQTYTVVANDYFIGIAKKLGVPLASLLAVNNMSTDSLITPGMKLKVPVGGSVPKAGAATTTTVKKP